MTGKWRMALRDEVIQLTGLKRKQVERAITATFNAIKRGIEEDHRVDISGFGLFWAYTRRAYKETDHLFHGGKVQEYPAKLRVRFRPYAPFRRLVNEDYQGDT